MKLISRKRLVTVLTPILILLSTVILMAQASPTPTPKDVRLSLNLPNASKVCQVTPTLPECKFVVVTQGYINDSDKAFALVIAQRDEIQKLLDTSALSTSERASYERLKAALNEVIAIKDMTLAAKDQLIEVYQKMNVILTDMVTKLQNQLNKPKSFFQKILDTLKEVALITGGILIGSRL